MTAPTVIDHSPAQINHVGLLAGTPWHITWAFGPWDAPDNLTGYTAKLQLGGRLYTLDVDGPKGVVTFAPSQTDTAAMGWDSSPYLLLLNGVCECYGIFAISDRWQG